MAIGMLGNYHLRISLFTQHSGGRYEGSSRSYDGVYDARGPVSGGAAMGVLVRSRRPATMPVHLISRRCS